MEAEKRKKSLFLPDSKIHSQNVTLPEMFGGYLGAPFLALLSNQIFSAYLNRYYVDVLDWTRFGAFAALLPIVSVFFVIAGNVAVGTMIDRTKTPQGKARPYLLLSVPFLILSIILLFMTPARASARAQMIFIALTYNLYYAVAYPCYYTAHNSLVSLSTRNSVQRGNLATLSNAALVGAAGLGGAIIVPVLLQSYMFVSGSDGLDMAASYRHWRILSVIFALVTAAGIILEYYLTRERITEEEEKLGIEKKEKVPAGKMIRACVREPYWWMAILFILFFQCGQQFKNGSMNFFVRWDLTEVIYSARPEQTAGSLTSLLGLLGGLPAVAGMLVIGKLVEKFGKKKCLLAGMMFAFAGGLAAFIRVHSFAIVCIGVVLKSIGIVPAQFVLLAMLSDVLDHLEAENGFRPDGFSMAIYSAVYAGLPGLCNGVLNESLRRAGYVNTGTAAAAAGGQTIFVQNAASQNALVVLYLGIDMATFLICCALVLRLNVEHGLKNDQQKITERQKQAVLAAGGTWTDPAERARIEKEQADEKAENERVRKLKKTCAEKGLDFEAENKAYLEKREKLKKSMIGRFLGL